MSPSPDRERKMIGSVQRALDILNLFDHQSAELGTTEIADAMGLHKSTAASLIYTLEANGYLDQNPINRKYRLGFKLVERGFTLLNQVDVRQVALPHLHKLHEWCDETVNLAIHDNDGVVYIERLLGTHPLGMRVEVGKRAPLYSTALGKAFMACMSLSELEQTVKRLELTPRTEKTITDPQRLLEEVHLTRERGYALDDEENELGGRCVAAPIFDHTGKAVAALSVSVPLPRIPYSAVPGFGEKVLETAKAISRNLGYIPRPY